MIFIALLQEKVDEIATNIEIRKHGVTVQTPEWLQYWGAALVPLGFSIRLIETQCDRA